MSEPDAEFLAAADRIYALPPADFVQGRAAEVKEASGDLKARLKALRKPSVAAWVVNLLVRSDPDQVRGVLEVGASLRAAQESMSAEQLRSLSKQRRQLTAAVTRRASTLAGQRDVTVSDTVADQVEDTLTAAMLDETAGQAVASGLLVRALQPNQSDALAGSLADPSALGFEASAVPLLTAVEAPADPGGADSSEAVAAHALRCAEVEVVNAREEVAESQILVDAHTERHRTAQARVLQLTGEIEELTRALEAAEGRLDEARSDQGEASDALDGSLARLQEAERAARQAEEDLDRLNRH